MSVVTPRAAVEAALARFPGARFDDGYHGICFDVPTPFRRLDEAAFFAEYDARLRPLRAMPVFVQGIDLAAFVPAGTDISTQRAFYSLDPQAPWEETTQSFAIVAGDALDVRGLRLAWRGTAAPVFLFHPDQVIALVLASEPLLMGWP